MHISDMLPRCSVQGPLQLGHNREVHPLNTTLYPFYAVTHSETESDISGWSDVCVTTDIKDPYPEADVKDPVPKADVKDPDPETDVKDPDPEADVKDPDPKSDVKDPDPEADVKNTEPDIYQDHNKGMYVRIY